ncbi:hypothetical protein EV44_g3346 [Erysiphe necator]|uniref:Uncharacterized protein n=1 Tax=Uncinula necator TaxID=52586 RepID=A0A0B1PBJ2_UNCNE|nr:hypothetical protein EV44_g3346 [Erysiphe necator]
MLRGIIAAVSSIIDFCPEMLPGSTFLNFEVLRTDLLFSTPFWTPKNSNEQVLGAVISRQNRLFSRMK